MWPFNWEETSDPSRKKAQALLSSLRTPDVNVEFLPLATQVASPIELPEGPRLVFVDGFFNEALSVVPKPLICQPLQTAMRSYGLFLQNRVAKISKENADPFALLNSALTSSGAFLYLPPKTELDLPIYQIHTQEKTATPRLFIFVGRFSQLRIQQIVQAGACVSNSLVDATLEEGASFSFEDDNQLPQEMIRLQTITAHLKKNSSFKCRLFAKGAKLERNALYVDLCEENGEAVLEGLSRLQGSEKSYVHTSIEHAAPHTRSRQRFRSVLDDQSCSHFEGKILVQPVAQKTESYQLSQNLLLSDEAVAHAKPNLEIFADDVKASHGATIGQLDPEQLFYLQSRGIPLQEARKWLIESFCK